MVFEIYKVVCQTYCFAKFSITEKFTNVNPYIHWWNQKKSQNRRRDESAITGLIHVCLVLAYMFII